MMGVGDDVASVEIDNGIGDNADSVDILTIDVKVDAREIVTSTTIPGPLDRHQCRMHPRRQVEATA